MTRHFHFAFAVLGCLLPMQLVLSARASEPFELQRVRLKDGRVLTMEWIQFGSEPYHLHARNGIPYCGNEPLRNQPAKLRQILAWAAEEIGVEGSIEAYTRRVPPFTLHLRYAIGVNTETGQELAVMLCAVTPEDQVRILNAAMRVQGYREHLAVRACQFQAADEARDYSRAAAQYAERAAHAAEEAATNTEIILDRLHY